MMVSVVGLDTEMFSTSPLHGFEPTNPALAPSESTFFSLPLGPAAVLQAPHW